MSLPTESDVEKALNYLAHTDELHAKAYAAKDAQKERLKLYRAKVFLESVGSVAERNAIADCSEDVELAIDSWENAVADFKLLDNKRNRAISTIDVWRSVNANRRQTT